MFVLFFYIRQIRWSTCLKLAQHPATGVRRLFGGGAYLIFGITWCGACSGAALIRRRCLIEQIRYSQLCVLLDLEIEILPVFTDVDLKTPAWGEPCKNESTVIVISGNWEYETGSLRRRQSNPLDYTVCVLVHDILFQIPLSRKDIYSRFWLVKTTFWTKTKQKQANQKRLYISMRLSGIWNKISCTNTQTVKTTVWHKQTGCSAG